MKAEIRAQRHLDKMKAAGVEFTAEEEAMILERFMQERSEKIVEQEIKSREAESVLALIRRQEFFIHKECRKCHGLFAADYAKVAYCSDSCRAAALADIGIDWNPNRPPEDRWGYNGERYHDDEGKEHNSPYPSPLVVPPQALKILARLDNENIRRFFKEAMLEVEPEETPIDVEPQQDEPKSETEQEPLTDPGQTLLDALGD